MSRPAYVDVGGKRLLWRDLIRMRKEQIAAAAPPEQPALFELKVDVKPDYARDIGRRFREPSLFDHPL